MKRKSLADLAVVLILTGIVGYAWSTGLLTQWTASTGYTSGFQGLDAEFAALYWQGGWWTAQSKPSGWSKTPSVQSFGGSMLLDPDTAKDGWCDLGATQRGIALVQDHIEPYEWTLQTQTESIRYKMEKVELSWSFNVYLDGTKEESCDTAPFSISWEPNYAGAQIWIRLTPKSYKYFMDSPDEFYIAPAYAALTQNVQVYAKDPETGQMIANSQRMSMISVSPNAAGEAFYIYYARGGAPVDVQQTLLSYKGKALDPQIFRNEYWIKVDLVNFKPANWFDWTTQKYQYPSVQFNVKMYAFVVGKWVTKLTQQDTGDLGVHQTGSDAKGAFDDLLKAARDWFNNPFNLLMLWMAAGVVLIIVLAIFVPSAVLMLFRGAGAAARAAGSAAKKAARKLRRKRR